jgi:hypothetical protein
MNCFSHPDVPAVGICKSCHKGLCVECAAEVTNGIACKDRCEPEAEALNVIVQKSKTAYAKTDSVVKRNGLVFFVIGVLLLMVGLGAAASNDQWSLLVIVVPISAVMLYVAYGSFKHDRQFDDTTGR